MELARLDREQQSGPEKLAVGMALAWSVWVAFSLAAAAAFLWFS
jgi:hypothetical protein